MINAPLVKVTGPITQALAATQANQPAMVIRKSPWMLVRQAPDGTTATPIVRPTRSSSSSNAPRWA